MDTVQNLIVGLNSFDTFYEFSDSSIKWELGKRQEDSLKGQLKTLNKKDLTKVKKGLDAVGKTNLDRYFKNI